MLDRFKNNRTNGFTIVELLIVVVVIAILATITIVAYNGIQNKAQDSKMQSTLSQALKKVKVFALSSNDQYPTSISSCSSTGATELCLPVAGTGETSTYSVENSTSPQSFCIDVAKGTRSYYVDDIGKVLPGSCSQQSCYSIQQSGGSHGSGTYWIKPTGAAQSIRAYCDMVTSGGGWTLLVNNVGPPTNWNASTFYNLNAAEPSLTKSYSMLQYGDQIKSNLSGNRMNYRIDAVELGRWGGVWDAPFSATLEGSTAQNVSSLTEKYDPTLWTQDTDPNDSNGTQTPSNVVPWYSSTYGIVTWGGTGNWWGAIATFQGGWLPTAPYMSGTLSTPSAIRYWVK